MERRRVGRADAMACVVAERPDVLSVTAEVRAALRRMGRDRCRVLQLHYAEHVDDRKALERKVRDAALALADVAYGKGCADFIGTVNMGADLLACVLDEGLPIATAQFSMSVADTRAAAPRGDAPSALEVCRARGVVPLAHGALLGGLLREESILSTKRDRRGRRRYATRLDVNSAGRAQGWAQIARASKSPTESLQRVLREIWAVSSEAGGAAGAVPPPIPSVALAWVLAEMDRAATGDAPEEGAGCLIVGHGRKRDYFNANRRAAEELFLDDDAAARIRDAAAGAFAALPGDVYEWERELL